jgi:hypothetical protein
LTHCYWGFSFSVFFWSRGQKKLLWLSWMRWIMTCYYFTILLRIISTRNKTVRWCSILLIVDVFPCPDRLMHMSIFVGRNNYLMEGSWKSTRFTAELSRSWRMRIYMVTQWLMNIAVPCAPLYAYTCLYIIVIYAGRT